MSSALKLYKKLQVFKRSSNFREATNLIELPLNEPTDGQIRVKNIYAGLNATDINMTAQRYFTDQFKIPFDIGFEGLGLIDSMGKNLPSGSSESLKIGQPVLIIKSRKPDMFSEYVYCRPHELVSVPELKPNYLCSFVNGLTATISIDKCGLIDQPKLHSNNSDDDGKKVVLITSAAGGTGQIAAQWCKKIHDCYVIGLTSTKDKCDYLKSELNLDLVINYKEYSNENNELSKFLNEKIPAGIDLIWDTYGGHIQKNLFNQNLSVGGKMILIGSTPDYKSQSDRFQMSNIDNLSMKLLMGSKTISGFMVFHWTKYFPEYLGRLIKMIHSDELKAKVDLGENNSGPDGKFFGLQQMWRAQEYLHQGKNLGKVVVQIQDP